MDRKKFLKSLEVSSLQEMRRIEKILRRHHKWSKKMTLREELIKKLPSYLVPSNIGDYNKVAWPFFQFVSFDFGTDPTYGPSTRQTSGFRVTQEAALVLQGIYRKAYTYDAAGELSALQIRLIDRQSTRQFNDLPIRIQNIGKNSRPTIFPTPMLIMPSAIFDVEVTSWLLADEAVTGSGRHDFGFFGYRVRVEDFDKVLSTIFA